MQIAGHLDGEDCEVVSSDKNCTFRVRLKSTYFYFLLPMFILSTSNHGKTRTPQGSFARGLRHGPGHLSVNTPALSISGKQEKKKKISANIDHPSSPMMNIVTQFSCVIYLF
jgi:hypothetical protein